MSHQLKWNVSTAVIAVSGFMLYSTVFQIKKIHCLINYRFKNFLIRTFEIMQPITEGRPASHAVPDYKYVHGQMAAATCGPLDRIITDYWLSQKQNIFVGDIFDDMCRMGYWMHGWFWSWFDVKLAHHFWRRYARKSLFAFSFPLPVTLALDL